MTHEDLRILAKMYANLLNERANKIIFRTIKSAEHPGKGHIDGSFPLGMFYVYNFPSIFEEHEHVLRMFDKGDPGLNENLIIIMAKYIMKQPGHNKAWRLTEGD